MNGLSEVIGLYAPIVVQKMGEGMPLDKALESVMPEALKVMGDLTRTEAIRRRSEFIAHLATSLIGPVIEVSESVEQEEETVKRAVRIASLTMGESYRAVCQSMKELGG